MKKLFALLVALTLVCSFSMTALAVANEDGTELGTDQDVKIDNTGDTIVSITSAKGDAAGQLSVTVPTSVTLAVKANATNENILGPDNYYITNNSAFAVKVTNVAVAEQGNFKITGAGTTDTDIGSITLKNSKEATGTALSAWMAAVTGTNWNMANSSASADVNKIKIQFGGTVTDVKQDISTAKTAFKITYTVAAGANI